jgi:hypothetical protein
MQKRFLTVSFALLSAFVVVWGVFVLFDLAEEYFATKQSPQYEALPFEFKLKANPEDVIFSEAYTTGDGRDVVEYAYLAGEIGLQLNEDISRRTSNSYTEVIKKFEDREGKPMETVKTTFLSKPSFYEKEGKWKQIEYATTTPEILSMSGAIPYIKKRELIEKFLPGSPAFATVSTFYPDPNVETNSVDGYVYDGDLGVNGDSSAACSTAWSGTQPGPGDSAGDSGTTMSMVVFSSSIYSEPFFECTTTIERVIVLFNTASLPDTANISAVDLKLYVTVKTNLDNDGLDTVNIVSSAPTSNTALAASDYATLGTTLYATAADISSISTSAYLTSSLNGTGIAAVNLTGVSKFGVREGHDLGNARPGNDESNSVIFSSADHADTSQDPKLEVTYTDKFGFGFWFPF